MRRAMGQGIGQVCAVLRTCAELRSVQRMPRVTDPSIHQVSSEVKA